MMVPSACRQSEAAVLHTKCRARNYLNWQSDKFKAERKQRLAHFALTSGLGLVNICLSGICCFGLKLHWHHGSISSCLGFI
jgi:hypothetical protein